MKIVITILLLLLNIKLAHSQTPQMDSLKRQLLSNTVPDTQRVLLLANLAAQTAYVRPDTAIIYAQQGVNLAKKSGFVMGEMYCKKAMGEAMWTAGEYAIANELLLQVLNYAKSLKDTHWQIIMYTILSANSRDQENYEEALKYSFKAIEVTKARKQLSTQEEWGLCYLEAGADYEEMDELDSALYYLQRVNFDDNSGYAGFKFLMMGRAYAKMGNNALASKYYTLCIKALAGTNNYKDVANAYNSIARIYEKEGKTDSCIYYAKKGFDVAQNGSFKKGIYELSLLLSEIYEKKNAALSFKYFKIATAAKDAMFNLQKTTQFLNSQFNEQLQQQELQQKLAQSELVYRNRLNIYFLLGGLVILIIVAGGLWRRNVYKQKSYSILQKQKQEIDIQKAKVEQTLVDLKSTQAQLIQSEKMASLGELTAGIAHEIQNPLNFVNNFSDVNGELISELVDEVDKGNTEEAKAIAEDIKQNLEKINHHGKRADAIVKGMLQHSKSSSGNKEPTDLNKLADEYLRLAYQGLRAKDKSFSADFKTAFDETIGKINIVPQDIGRVLLNLFNNAFYAVNEKKTAGNSFQPTVSVQTKRIDNKIEIKVCDNGSGMPQNIVDKIFQPFFTTKPTGLGTGLGLSLSYDIIKAHGGEIKVETKENEGSEFVIQLPM
jgi:two-component system NtrC family sensor kinase